MLPRYLILDVDDTLTVEGRLGVISLQALERASGAGLEVILNTGRSAGWGKRRAGTASKAIAGTVLFPLAEWHCCSCRW